jgi:hypothetical protein
MNRPQQLCPVCEQGQPQPGMVLCMGCWADGVQAVFDPRPVTLDEDDFPSLAEVMVRSLLDNAGQRPPHMS